MGRIIAFVIIAVIVAMGVGGAVLHPVLYGLFIAAVLIIPGVLISGYRKECVMTSRLGTMLSQSSGCIQQN